MLTSKRLTQKRLNAPWLSKDVMKCIRKKHIWYRLKNNNVISYESYKSYCKILRTVLRLAEENYMTKKN